MNSACGMKRQRLTTGARALMVATFPMNPPKLCILFFATLSFIATNLIAAETAAVSTIGAWRIAGEPQRVMIVTPHYWTQTVFDRERSEFVRTMGGTYVVDGDVTRGTIEFDSQAPETVGSSFQVTTEMKGDALKVAQEDGAAEVWTKIDLAENALAGTWRITGREVGGEIQEMPLRARRTLKILSGTRFQWVAMNVETGEFSGTGGGTYTFEDGKYTERIEFFSRDGSRVGATLEFEGKVDGDTWDHRGRSSKGDPIHEIWTRFDPTAVGR